ncbi:olfactomedin-like [Protopterus annectens]|uniref:olfactomedin-like n=1 Tax=Protopterus annectens TaxID=7888 RepID=UPI001CF931A7|nr:olfactomedin-like [Protopterus annectens]
MLAFSVSILSASEPKILGVAAGLKVKPFGSIKSPEPTSSQINSLFLFCFGTTNPSVPLPLAFKPSKRLSTKEWQSGISKSISSPLTGGNVTGEVDENGECICKVFLPDTTFPANRIENLEHTSTELTKKIEVEVTKLHNYELILKEYSQKLVNLTVRVDHMEQNTDKYTQLDFELIRIELREMEILISQLKGSTETDSEILNILHEEVKNLTTIVNEMESYDTNNVLLIRKQIKELQHRLEDCHSKLNETIPPETDFGSCNHRGIKSFSQPFIVQLNYHGAAYIDGAWGKDPYPVTGRENLHWVTPVSSNAALQAYLFASSYENLLIHSYFKSGTLATASQGSGSGIVMYKNNLYYNCYRNQYMCRLNVDTLALEKSILTGAGYSNTYPYSSSVYQDMDFAVDEQGLWVIYATSANGGNIVISKINEAAFLVEKTWNTNIFKKIASNAFMICGVLHATRSTGSDTEEVFATYDTKTSTEGIASIRFSRPLIELHSLSYNPKDHKLYMYSKGYLINYNVHFHPK